MRVLVYLLRTRRLGITYSKHGEDAERLFARADANWRSTRSTTGFWFEKHRKVVLNLGAGESNDEVKQQRIATLSAWKTKVKPREDGLTSKVKARL